jgi:ribosome biogenesis GTPase / thiamine phosphate phosphatase
MTHHNLNTIGWKPFFQQQVPADGSAAVIVARVSAHHGSQVLLLGEDGEFSIHVQLAQSAGDIAVGDWLVLDAKDNRAIQRLERQTLLFRQAPGGEVKPQVIAANIDTIFIVCSCNEDFNPSRIERYLALALQTGTNPVVVLTKPDLCEDAADYQRQAEQLQAGLAVLTIDARSAEQAKALITWCGPGQTVALMGSSGVGKSTLANALGAGELATGSIREQDGKGRHTTTARSLHLLPSGGVLMDNPGVRELKLPECEEGITDLFEDVFQIAERCRFNNCSHEEDAGCAIKLALKSGELNERRYVSFKKLIAEQAHNARTLAERHASDRATSRFHKSVLANKRRRGRKR